MYSLISTDIFSPEIQNNWVEFAKGYNFVVISFCALGKNLYSVPGALVWIPADPSTCSRDSILPALDNHMKLISLQYDEATNGTG